MTAGTKLPTDVEVSDWLRLPDCGRCFKHGDFKWPGYLTRIAVSNFPGTEVAPFVDNNSVIHAFLLPDGFSYVFNKTERPTWVCQSGQFFTRPLPTLFGYPNIDFVCRTFTAPRSRFTPALSPQFALCALFAKSIRLSEHQCVACQTALV